MPVDNRAVAAVEKCDADVVSIMRRRANSCTHSCVITVRTAQDARSSWSSTRMPSLLPKHIRQVQAEQELRLDGAPGRHRLQTHDEARLPRKAFFEQAVAAIKAGQVGKVSQVYTNTTVFNTETPAGNLKSRHLELHQRRRLTGSTGWKSRPGTRWRRAPDPGPVLGKVTGRSELFSKAFKRKGRRKKWRFQPLPAAVPGLPRGAKARLPVHAVGASRCTGALKGLAESLCATCSTTACADPWQERRPGDHGLGQVRPRPGPALATTGHEPTAGTGHRGPRAAGSLKESLRAWSG